MARSKKGTASWYRKKCDQEFGKLVRSRGACEKCGKTETLQCAHVVPRTNYALRWDPINALCLCHRHNLYWAHKDPLAFQAWLADKLPHVTQYVQENRNRVIKRSRADYAELYENLKKANKGDLEAAKKLMVGDH